MKKIKRFGTKTTIALVSCFALSLIVFHLMASEKNAGNQFLTGVIKDIENPDAGFEIALWTDREDATYKPGDEVKFSFKTDKNCYLTLLNVSTSGEVKVLFPNEYQKDNLVKAGNTYSVPGEEAKYIYKADKPYGVEIVKAIATLKEVALYKSEEVEPTGPFQEFKETEQKVAKNIDIVLKPVDTKKWAEVEKTIRIVEDKA